MLLKSTYIFEFSVFDGIEEKGKKSTTEKRNVLEWHSQCSSDLNFAKKFQPHALISTSLVNLTMKILIFSESARGEWEFSSFRCWEFSSRSVGFALKRHCSNNSRFPLESCKHYTSDFWGISLWHTPKDLLQRESRILRAMSRHSVVQTPHIWLQRESRIVMCDMTHSYVTWLVHVWHDLFMSNVFNNSGFPLESDV